MSELPIANLSRWPFMATGFFYGIVFGADWVI